MELNERTLSSERAWEGRVFWIDQQEVELADGSRSRRDLLRHAGGVGVLARHPSGEMLLVRQFRKALDQEVLEIVAGMREPGEAAEATARRELEEETGFKAARLEYLGQSYASPGYTDEVVELFFAETEAEAGGLNLDQDERVLVESLSCGRFAEAMQNNEIRDSKSIAAWALAHTKGLI